MRIIYFFAYYLFPFKVSQIERGSIFFVMYAMKKHRRIAAKGLNRIEIIVASLGNGYEIIRIIT